MELKQRPVRVASFVSVLLKTPPCHRQEVHRAKAGHCMIYSEAMCIVH